MKFENDLSPREASSRILVSAPEAAQMLGVSVSYFVRQKLPKVRFGRRCCRYQLSEIEKLIARRLIASRDVAAKQAKEGNSHACKLLA